MPINEDEYRAAGVPPEPEQLPPDDPSPLLEGGPASAAGARLGLGVEMKGADPGLVALERIAARPEVTEIVCTNTVPIPDAEKEPKLKVISLASALAEAIRRIHEGESVSALFDH